MSTFKNISGIFLLVVLVGILYLTWQLFAPFIAVIVVAGVFSALFYPVYTFFLRHVRSKSVASLIACLLVFLCIILPISLIIWLLVLESYDAFLNIQAKVLSGQFDAFFATVNEWIQKLPLANISDKFSNFAIGDNLDLIQKAVGFAQDVSGWAYDQATLIVSSTASIIINFFLLFFTMFYFFKDGKSFLGYVIHISPLSMKYEREIFSKFRAASKSIMLGTFATALLQGFLGGIGFWIVGFSPFLWGVVMAFFSLVPVVGASIIWIPAAIVLFIKGEWTWGIFLLLWGGIVISSADNFARPFLMKGGMSIHPLIIFFAIMGGLSMFGFFGLIFGPLIVALAATMLHIYELEYATVLHDEDNKE